MRDRGRPGIAQQPGKRNVRKLGRAVCDKRGKKRKNTDPAPSRGSSRGQREGTAGGGRRRREGARKGGGGGVGTGVRPTHLRLPCRRPRSSVPGSLRAGPGAGAGSAAALAQDGSGARLRAAPAAALALPPRGQRGLAARACPQGPPRRRGSAPGTCSPGGWGGEVRTAPHRPAAGQLPSFPSSLTQRRGEAEGLRAPRSP